MQLPKALHIVETHRVTSKMEPTVNEHRAVTCRKNEAVAVEPLWRSGVEIEGVTEKNGAHICATKRETKVTGRTCVDAIDREATGLSCYSSKCFFIHEH